MSSRDITRDITKILGNIIKLYFDQNSIKETGLKFTNDYKDGMQYIRFENWPTLSRIKLPLTVCFPASCYRYDRNTGDLIFEPIGSINFFLGTQGYLNAHVWGKTGLLCRGGVEINNIIDLVKCILDVLLLKNTTLDSLRVGRACPDSTLVRNCNGDIYTQYQASKNYQQILKNFFDLNDDVFSDQNHEYVIRSGSEKMMLGAYIGRSLGLYAQSLKKIS